MINPVEYNAPYLPEVEVIYHLSRTWARRNVRKRLDIEYDIFIQEIETITDKTSDKVELSRRCQEAAERVIGAFNNIVFFSI